MTDREQTEHFADELDKLINRFRQEYEITHAAVVGTMYIAAHQLICEAAADDND